MKDGIQGPSGQGNSRNADNLDDRWGGYVPWFLRYSEPPRGGDLAKFFARVGQRLERLMNFNEVGIGNFDQFGARLETDSLQRFHHHPGTALGGQLKGYFDPRKIRQTAEVRCQEDPEEQRVQNLFARQTSLVSFTDAMPSPSEELDRARDEADRTRIARIDRHWQVLAAERLGVLEALLIDLHETATASLGHLIRDLRRAGAEAQIPLDIRGDPPRIIPLEERLLQSGVIDPLLGRLQGRWPERARELIDAYHDLLAGRRLDEVFLGAYKSLEEIARSVADDPKFDFSQKDMQRHFAHLHPTIHQTIYKLRDHRGDTASHGRKAPNASEIRYLLFQICNVALLLLDYESQYGTM
jgi:hypothetical protein